MQQQNELQYDPNASEEIAGGIEKRQEILIEAQSIVQELLNGKQMIFGVYPMTPKEEIMNLIDVFVDEAQRCGELSLVELEDLKDFLEAITPITPNRDPRITINAHFVATKFRVEAKICVIKEKSLTTTLVIMSVGLFKWLCDNVNAMGVMIIHVCSRDDFNAMVEIYHECLGKNFHERYLNDIFEF